MEKQRKYLNEETGKIIMALIAIAVAVAVGLFLWSCLDFESATAEDYNYLYEHFEALQSQGIEALHDMEDVEVRVAYGKLTLESTECSLVFELTDERTFTETERRDKAWLGVNLLAPIFIIVIVCGMLGRFFYELETTFAFIGKWCFTKIKSLSKRKRES